MTDSFSFHLKNNRNQKYLKIGWMLLLLNLFLFLYLLVTNGDKTMLLPIAFIFGSWMLLLTVHFLNKKSLSIPKTLAIALFMAALGWWLVEMPFLAVTHILLCIVSWRLPDSARVIFNAAGITIPAMPWKTFPWSSIAHVIWKDQLLTIDFKNNVLIQEETIEALSLPENTAFHTFVNGCLHPRSEA